MPGPTGGHLPLFQNKMTNAQQMPGGGEWARLELTKPCINELFQSAVVLYKGSTPNSEQIAPCKGIHDSLGFWILPCGFRIPSTRFRISAQWIPDSKKGWIPIFFLFYCFSSHFVFVFESCYTERRCLVCITSLFSFSIYKLREEMYYCSVRV